MHSVGAQRMHFCFSVLSPPAKPYERGAQSYTQSDPDSFVEMFLGSIHQASMKFV